MSKVPAKRGRKGKWRDPDKPKRPYSAYNFFAKEMYPQIGAGLKNTSTNPDESKATSIMSQIATKWRELDEAGRSSYQEKAAVAKAEHKIALANYKQKKANGETEKRPRQKRDKTKPKRAKSCLYCHTKSSTTK